MIKVLWMAYGLSYNFIGQQSIKVVILLPGINSFRYYSGMGVVLM